MKGLSNIFKWLLVFLTLAAGLVVVVVACTVRAFYIITSHKVQAAVPATSACWHHQQQPVLIFNRVKFQNNMLISKGK